MAVLVRLSSLALALTLVLDAPAWVRSQDDGMGDFGGGGDDGGEDGGEGGYGGEGMDGEDGGGGGYGEDDEDEYGEGGGGGGGGSSGGGDAPMGALKLDNYTLDKVVGLEGQTVLVKFDEPYPYGEKEDEFKELCKVAYGVPKFFVGVVGVEEFGDDKENDGLRERFGLKKEDFPAFIYFKTPTEQVRYTGTVAAADLASWLRRMGLNMPAIGTITEFDEIVSAFLKDGKAAAHIAALQKLAEGDFKEDRKAPMYVKIMQKVQEKGVGYIAQETARLTRIMGGKLTDEKRAEISDKLRILTVFDMPPPRDEL